MTEAKNNPGPNKKTNNKIVVGMTGRMDSIVVAYLLKKQGLQPIAVSVINFEKMFGKKMVKDGVFDKIVESEITLSGACHIDDINQTKSICDQLGIPFYATSSKDVFREEILGKLITQRLAGEKFSPCLGCHALIIKTLLEKAKTLGADKVATGHYAKILSAHSGKQMVVGRSNDLANDQSYLLAGLGHAELCQLELPLSEMRKADVQKIAESLGLSFQKNDIKSGDCLQQHPNLNDFLSSMTPFSLRKPASLLDFKNDVFIADHKGFHQYTVGQKNLTNIDGLVDKEATVVDIDPATGHMYLGDWNAITYRLTVLKNFSCDDFLDRSRPIEAYARFETHAEPLACIAFFRTLDMCVLLFKNDQKGRAPAGKLAVLYNRPGMGAKVLGYGQIMSYGPFENLEKLFESPDMADPVEALRNNKAKEDNKKLRF